MDPAATKSQLETLQKLLDDLPDEDFQVFADLPAAQRSAELAERIAATEAALGAPLAAEHRAIIERWGALAVVAKPSAWPRPQQFEIRPAWQFAFAVEVFGMAAARALDVLAQSQDHAPAVVTPAAPVPPAAPEVAAAAPDAVAAAPEAAAAAPDVVAAAPDAAAAAPAPRLEPIPFMHVAGSAHRIGYDQAGRLYEWKRGEEPVPIPTAGILARVLEALNALRRDTESIKKNPPRPATPPARSVDALLAEINGATSDLETLPAFESLRTMGPAAAAAIPALQALTRDPSAYRRASAHAALLGIEGNVAEHARALIDLLGNTEASGAAGAAAEIALTRLGADARPHLEAALLHTDPAVRAKASALLARAS